ncbi:hypothetical protein DSO57_1021423 [Entomophthora muscae]|uniref:Uncharacterized protein n=1 Tax=Entomophthora muscae TaxID=34485 RepID=A0ACC2T3V5_9FUNG|nr:hypothetical protein DSO57_1021423 [Entomophthora muscae]
MLVTELLEYLDQAPISALYHAIFVGDKGWIVSHKFHQFFEAGDDVTGEIGTIICQQNLGATMFVYDILQYKHSCHQFSLVEDCRSLYPFSQMVNSHNDELFATVGSWQGGQYINGYSVEGKPRAYKSVLELGTLRSLNVAVVTVGFKTKNQG